MTLRIFRTITILAAAVASAACSGRSDRAASGTPRRVFARVAELTDSAAAVDTLDFGRMRSGETVEQTIGLRNASQRPMVVLRTETSCGCTAVDFDRAPVRSGDTLAVGIRFDSRGFEGWQWKRVLIYTSLSDSPVTVYVESEVY